MSVRTHYSHMRKYLQPMIYKLWRMRQSQILQSYKGAGGHLILGGDM